MAATQRILVVVERFPPDLGGLARSGSRIAAALARLGVEVEVLAWTRASPPGVLETTDAGDVEPAAAGVTLHRLGLYAHLDFSLQYTMNVLEWLHGERGFDAVWGHYLFPSGFAAVLFAETAGLPVTVSARGNDVDRMTFPPGDFARLQWTLERTRLVTAVSRELARKVRVLLRPGGAVEEGRVLVTPNVVDPEVFTPGDPPAGLREELGIAPDEAVLVFAGELREKKGFPFLLEALTEVRARRPACLLVIGEVRPREQSRLAGFAAERPEDDARIIVTGRLDDPARVADHLRLGDVFLHPSVWDGLPNAVLEAMACGTVVLGSDAGGIPDAVEHERSGYLIPKAHLHRLGVAVLEVLDLEADARAAVEAAARQRVLDAFSPAVEQRALADVLQRLTGASPASS